MIDDADLCFDGKPLNMLYEENRWKAGVVYRAEESRVSQVVRHQRVKLTCVQSSRGRSRQSKR